MGRSSRHTRNRQERTPVLSSRNARHQQFDHRASIGQGRGNTERNLFDRRPMGYVTTPDGDELLAQPPCSAAMVTRGAGKFTGLNANGTGMCLLKFRASAYSSHPSRRASESVKLPQSPVNGRSRWQVRGWGSRLSFALWEGCHNANQNQTARTRACRRVVHEACDPRRVFQTLWRVDSRRT